MILQVSLKNCLKIRIQRFLYFWCLEIIAQNHKIWVLDQLCSPTSRLGFTSTLVFFYDVKPIKVLFELSSTNIWGLHSNLVGCESFLESNSADILALLRQIWMTQLSLAISLRGYLLLIQKDYITHVHGLAVYVKEGLPFAQDLSLVNSYLCRFLLMFLTSFTSLSVLLLFPLLITFFVVMHGFWFFFI